MEDELKGIVLYSSGLKQVLVLYYYVCSGVP